MSGDVQSVESALKLFWEKARAASDLIAQLRGEKRSLETKIVELNREVQALRTEIASKDQDFKRLRMEHTQLINANGHGSFTAEERENLKGKIRDLIAKINSHL